ncbi:MAG: ATP-binding protein [Candidatus Magnetomorum sp.]|nr:ATP-binding protein [Candidatus Magnetomorum sp.]
MNIVKREILEELIPWLGEKKCLIIKGARQTGKTTLLNLLKKNMTDQGKKVIYFSIDQEIDNPIFKNPRFLLRFLKEQENIDENQFCYLMLDEFQYIQSPGMYLKVLFDLSSDYIQVIATGSSALEISQEKEFLTGRKIEFILDRFSFREYLNCRSSYNYSYQWKIGEPIDDLKAFYQIYREDLEHHFLAYLNWGGYPEISLMTSIKKKEIILKELLSTYIQKDVSDFLKISNISGFNKLVIYLGTQTGNLVNVNELANTLGLDNRTIYSYLDILKHTFIFEFVSPFFTNKRKELSKMPKVFANDMSIVHYATKAFYSEYRMIPGNLIENFVFIHLKKNDTLNFYRTNSGAEIDFLIQQHQFIIPIEVKFRKKVSTPVIFKNFSKNYSISHSIILSQDTIKQEQNVYFIPVPLLAFINIVN